MEKKSEVFVNLCIVLHILCNFVYSVKVQK